MRLLRALPLPLIAAGLALLLLGGAHATRPASNPASGKTSHIRDLNHLDSQYAELHQALRDYVVCEETARTDPAMWSQWPCDRVRR